MKPIELKLTSGFDEQGKPYQHLNIKMNNNVSPKELKSLSLPQLINPSLGLVVEGARPNWLCGYLVLQYLDAAWIGCYYPQLEGAVVVQSKIPEVKVGEVLPVSLLGKQSSPPTVLLDGQVKQEVTEVYTVQGSSYQCLSLDVNNISPQVLSDLKISSNLDRSRGIILWGSAPVWLYAYLVLQIKSVPWVACYNLRNGAVITNSNCAEFTPGDMFDLVPKLPCPAILVGGPPDSGKSVLCHALDQTLEHQGLNNQLHLHRAHWDYQGDWYAVMENRDLAWAISVEYGVKPEQKESLDKKRFFEENAELVSKVRGQMNLVLVDFGGCPKPSDVILLRRCTHYIIISSKRKKIEAWHKFCGEKGKLKPLAVIHSVKTETLEVLATEPYLEIVAGPWEYGKTKTVPEVLLEQVLQLVKTCS